MACARLSRSKVDSYAAEHEHAVGKCMSVTGNCATGAKLRQLPSTSRQRTRCSLWHVGFSSKNKAFEQKPWFSSKQLGFRAKTGVFKDKTRKPEVFCCAQKKQKTKKKPPRSSHRFRPKPGLEVPIRPGSTRLGACYPQVNQLCDVRVTRHSLPT